MKTFAALAALALLFSPVAKAQYVLTIDLTDTENVVVSATGEFPTASYETPEISGVAGVTLMNFFSGSSTLFTGAAPEATLQTNGMTGPYAAAYANDFSNPFSGGSDFTIAFGEGAQIFLLSTAAFSGSVTFNLAVESSFLPLIGTTGDIRVGDGFLGDEIQPASAGPVIGQYRVVPEPTSALLVTAAGVALLGLRRRR